VILEAAKEFKLSKDAKNANHLYETMNVREQFRKRTKQEGSV
jgi:hypothetical protein